MVTNYICKELPSKQDHILMGQVDTNVGGHCSTQYAHSLEGG